MKTKALTKISAWSVVFSMILVLGFTTAHTQEKFKMAGTGEFTFSDGKEFNIDDVEGHTIRINKAEGKNISTGETEWMHNARTVNTSFADVIQGNGSHQGYITLENGGDKVVSQWEGKMITKLSTDGKPVTTFEGNMWWVEATGKYENMHGVATYKGWFTSQNTYRVEWEGEYWKK